MSPSQRQPLLAGYGVTLRPLQRSDWAELFAAASDPVIWEQHPQSDRYKEAVFRAFFEEALDSGGALVVIEQPSGRIIGSSRFVWHDEAKGILEIGWTFLTRDHWGGTTNAECKRLMIEHGLGFATEIVFFVGLGNLRSQRALEKIGARRRGLGQNGRGRESVVFEVTAETWSWRSV